MPKRKRDECERIACKIRRLEKRLRRKQRRSRLQYYSDQSESSETSHASQHKPLDNQDNEMDYVELIDNEEAVPDMQAPSNEVQADAILIRPDLGLEPDPTPSTSQPAVSEDLGLDSELLDILGTDPTVDKKYGNKIQNDLSIRLQHWSTIGLAKELRKELKEKYLTPDNCKFIDPPELNAEIKAAVSDAIVKRDKAIENKQRQMTSAISCLSEAITLTMSAKEKNTNLLKLLMDTARLICDCQHADSVTRRNFLLNSVKKELREQLQDTKIDKLLFGENLAETLKSAKAISKSGADLKPPAASKLQNKKPSQIASNSSRHLNWKSQGPVRRQTGPTKTKEPARTSTRSRQTNSSKQFHHQQQRQNYNRR